MAIDIHNGQVQVSSELYEIILAIQRFIPSPSIIFLGRLPGRQIRLQRFHIISEIFISIQFIIIYDSYEQNSFNFFS